MPTINLTFSEPLNVSIQANPNATVTNPEGADIVYFSLAPMVGGFNTTNALTELGPVTAITNNIITCEYSPGMPTPNTSSFIMFCKNRIVNMSSLLGYFGEFRIRNNSTEKAEMYSISVDVSESSK